MKPFKEVINYPVENSFVLRYNDFAHFSVPWHFHNEFEMIYVVRGTGKRFVGDVVENFAPGDLVFYGSTLPHFHHNDAEYYSGNPALIVNAYILQFPIDYFSKIQLKSPEFAGILRLLANSSRGLKFPLSTREQAALMLNVMYAEKGLKKYLLLIEFLNFLGQSEFLHIASPGYANTMNNHVEDRMVKVYEFSTLSYNRKISLIEVASVAGMNTTAFCRYFRKKAGKTFAEFINELRISYACKLLRHGNQTISFVCCEAGFNNISNFNRQFKSKIGKSPSEYRGFIHNHID
jgi:AraC-like DNA-binding protein